jgi:hypothetical protein
MRPKFCKYHSAIGKERKEEKGKEEIKKKENKSNCYVLHCF